MNGQLAIPLRIERPEATPPAQRHSPTSVEAAVMALPKVGTWRRQVYDWLCEFGPGTDEDIAEGLGMNPSTARPRRIELLDDGLITEAGEAKNKSGRKAVLWEVVR